MPWDNDTLEIWGNGLTVLADLLLVLAASNELKETKESGEKRSLFPARIDLLGEWSILISDTLLSAIAISAVVAKKRGNDPPEHPELENMGNWGCLFGDALAIFAAGLGA